MREDIRKAVTFLEQVGIPTRATSLQFVRGTELPFLDGVWVEEGVLVYHAQTVRLEDLYHEAGHLASVPVEQWSRLPLATRFDEDFTSEAFAVAWEVAALIAGTGRLAGGAQMHVRWRDWQKGITLLQEAGLDPYKTYPKLKCWTRGGLGEPEQGILCTKRSP